MDRVGRNISVAVAEFDIDDDQVVNVVQVVSDLLC